MFYTDRSYAVADNRSDPCRPVCSWYLGGGAAQIPRTKVFLWGLRPQNPANRRNCVSPNRIEIRDLGCCNADTRPVWLWCDGPPPYPRLEEAARRRPAAF